VSRRPLASFDRLPTIDRQLGGSPQLHAEELRHVITTAINAHPRSQQQEIGPSEIGTPCTLRLGYKLAGNPPTNVSGLAADGWKATVGTAVHAWLADVFVAANRSIDPARWIVEARVNIGEIDDGSDDPDVMGGSCDVFDRVTCRVTDWKLTGLNKIKAYRANGPGEQYRVQAHSYGLGFAQRGEPVAAVGIMFLPRDGLLAQSYYWSEPYDAEVARAALRRASGVATLLRLVDPATVLRGLPRAPAYCTYCPWYRPGAADPAVCCPGAQTY
jgi:hypothetical protein